MCAAHPLSYLGILDDEVVEPLDVARCMQHRVRHEVGALDLEHALLEHKVAAPEGEQIGLERAAGGSKVVEAFGAAVDLEGGHDEHDRQSCSPPVE